MKNLIIFLSIICIGWLIALGIRAADGVVSVQGGNTQVGGTLPQSSLPAGVLTNNQSTATIISNTLTAKVAGSAAAPSVGLIDGIGALCGIYSPANGSIGFSSGGSESFRVATTSFALIAGNVLKSDYYADRANTKGYVDTTVTAVDFSFTNRVTGNVNVTIDGVPSQTADLQQWRSSGTAVVGKMSIGGILAIQSITLTNNLTLVTTNAAPAGLIIGTTVPAVWFAVTNAGNKYLIPGYSP